MRFAVEVTQNLKFFVRNSIATTASVVRSWFQSDTSSLTPSNERTSLSARGIVRSGSGQRLREALPHHSSDKRARGNERYCGGLRRRAPKCTSVEKISFLAREPVAGRLFRVYSAAVLGW